MAAPIVTWHNPTTGDVVSQWNIGTVDAGSISPEFTVRVWNNNGAAPSGSGTDVSTMESVTITTKDTAGGNTGEVVADKWIEARCDSPHPDGIGNGVGDVDIFGKIGGTQVKVIEASGAVDPNTIEGVANDGDPAAYDNCFADITLRANVPSTATAGNQDFLTRVAYQYV